MQYYSYQHLLVSEVVIVTIYDKSGLLLPYRVSIDQCHSL